jgi:TPR repeat protein
MTVLVVLANIMTLHNNTMPSLAFDHPPEYSEKANPPQNSSDSVSALDQFATLRISELGAGVARHLPRHANTFPPPPVSHTGDSQHLTDNPSLYSRDSANNNWHVGAHGDVYDASFEPGRTNHYSHDGVDAFPSPNGYGVPDAVHSVHHFPHQPQLGYQPSFSSGQVHLPASHPTEYNPLYAAASSVLGMAPTAMAPPQTHAALRSTYNQSPYTDNQRSSSSSPSVSLPYTGSYQQMRPHLDGDPLDVSSQDIESRPPLHRSGTTASVILRTQKTKAVDLTAPPYTKEYIDQYRQRIKADPDPEAHFLYAKYLIDAAKKIGADARDQRAVKKYRDLLIAESLKVIRRLATQGQAYDEAQFFLANCYGTGMLGLQVDHERAYHLYLQAAKQNHAAASYRVAVCNEIGAGTRREPPRAAAFYRKAASLGDTPAMYKLGMILLHGSLGEQKNPREAINWLKRAAEQADEENPHALHELGLLHEMPNSQLVVHDPVSAKNLFTQAAHLGYTQSQYKLGQCYEYGALTCPVDPRRSIAWYTKAAEKGNSEAELALSGWYLTGSEGVLKQSDSEAYLWARRAANKGLSAAEYAVGYYAEVGIGIKQDIEFAKRWYMRAAGE